jgi:pyruvate/2-oxoglutarate dehydrogenase complex dihydrolipoamide dehydrogenase (E3) component
MSIAHFDLVVIGAGSGGLSVAAGAAQMGARVALIEAGEMGGDCLNSGCVPSKALLAAAKQAHIHATASRFGIEYDPPRIDFAAVKNHVADVIAQIAPHDSQERFESLGVKVVRGFGKFIDARTVEAAGERFTAKRFVIATGSRATVPPIAGLQDTPHYTNESLFADRAKPEHLIIIGGGAIGAEMAQAHVRLGCKVTILEAFTMMPRDDSEAVAVVKAALQAEGVRIIENAKISAVKGHIGAISAVLENGETINASHILVAAGRTPNIQTMGLEAAGIHFEKNGIVVDARLRTAQKHIYAIGDCRQGPQFTHAAGYDAGIVIRNLLFRLPAKANYSAMPWVTYTDPELAQVGLTEAAARKLHGDVTVLKMGFDANDRAISERRTGGFIKVISRGAKVLGVTAVGVGAGEQMALWAQAVAGKLSLGDIAGQIMPYPTYQELGKRIAGSSFTSRLYSARTKSLVRLLLKLPYGGL